MGVYYPKGVCSQKIQVEVDSSGKIEEINVVGGCSGNLGGICALLKGADARETIQKLRGTDCRGRGTSCPDQIAIALEQELLKTE
ncbi:MAG: TIGR03905 family TSCPD domain-containing protein [Clostridia bacterium]|nr:TIGR03905 family TSCPD domain-containing protein [Clostridia bacterium]